MKQWQIRLFLLLPAMVPLAGCLPDLQLTDRCETMEDCYQGEGCLQGRCVPLAELTDLGARDQGLPDRDQGAETSADLPDLPRPQDGGADVGCLPTTPEACNGQDDDCDGQTDEELVPPADACLATGVCRGAVPACGGAQGWLCAYPLESYEISETRCDGLDNDCDGQTDEGAVAPPGTCLEQGVCRGTSPVCNGEQGWLCPYPRGSYEPTETLCDEQDNDCNGETDDVQGGCACVDGTARICSKNEGECREGNQSCRDGRWGACVNGVEPTEESCDRLDNDCDGFTDEVEDLVVPEETGCLDLGVCAGVQPQCDSGRWNCPYPEEVYAEEPEEGAPELRCDGLDNDCDGETDDGFGLDEPCALGTGECRREGVTVCLNEEESGCGAVPGPAVAELCDGLDNDCDEQTDEGFSLDEPCTVGQGVCAAEGLIVCLSLEESGCDAEPGEPEPQEQCDGLDNDCDGDPDDGFSLGEPCTVGLGVCAAEGPIVCLSLQESGCDAVQGPSDGPESCDGRDNDCDGQKDEDEAGAPLRQSCYSGPSTTRGRGLCHDGEQTCADGGWGACLGEQLPGVEVCDGEDNDCDGAEDEDEQGEALSRACYDGTDSTRGIGICHAGRQSCGVGGVWGACQGQQLPKAESCNGTDDDCDRAADEGEDGLPLSRACFDGPDSSREVGLCRDGRQQCEGGGWGSCVGQVLPVEESCDGQDNDCDGMKDEDELGQPLTRPCYTGPEGTLDVGLCRAGVQTCAGARWGDCLGQQLPVGELCDGADNDCDELLDLADPDLQAVQPWADEQDGVCAGAKKACNGSAGWSEPDFARVVPGYQPVETWCDGTDNDCDEATDLDDPDVQAARPDAARQDGVCAGAKKECGPAGWEEPDYAAVVGPDYQERETRCDGLDNDCNGIKDDVFNLGAPCATGIGECRRSGRLVCDLERRALVCDAVAGQPAAESCDGKDNDCDDRTDEDTAFECSQRLDHPALCRDARCVGTQVFFWDRMEDGQNGWMSTYTGGAQPWRRRSQRSFSPIHAWHSGPTPQAAGDALLISPVVDLRGLSAGSRVMLRFVHWYDFDDCGLPDFEPDGGVIEISRDYQQWERLFPLGGYPGVIEDGADGNPLQGQPAFVHDSGGMWKPVFVDLSRFVDAVVYLGFHVGYDYQMCESTAGWYVDDVAVYLDPL